MRLAGAARAALAALCVLAPPAAAQTFKISYAGINANFAQYFAAEDKGYFKDEGSTFELVQLGGGTATPALIAGDLAYSGSPSSGDERDPAPARSFKVILIGQSKPIYELWSFDPEVRTLADLKGKPVGLTQHGGTDELALRMLLRARGLPPDFVTLVMMGSLSNNVAALLSGAERNGVITRVEKGQLAGAGMLGRGRMIVNFHDEIRLQTGGLVTTAKEISEHPDRVKRVLRAVWKGTLYLMHEREGVMDIVHRREPGLAPETLAADVEGGMADMDREGVMPMDAASHGLRRARRAERHRPRQGPAARKRSTISRR